MEATRTVSIDPADSDGVRFQALLEILREQERAIAELSDLCQKQADSIVGLTQFLRGLVDIALEDEQRAMLQAHLELSLAVDASPVHHQVIAALLD